MRYAYVTTLSGGDAYLPGVEVLGRSLIASGTHERRLVMVTPDVPTSARDRLSDQGWEIVPVDPIESPSPETAQLYPRFARTFTKLRAFGLTSASKIVLLDADTVVMRNIDDLFQRPSVAAAPDFFLPDRFNSGVMVIEPSSAFFAHLHDALRSVGSYDGGDQGFLNEMFPDWYARPVSYRLPAGYNLHHFVFQFLMAHESLKSRVLSEVRVLHFTLQKPWMGLTLSGGAEVWWRFFFAQHPEEDHSWRRRLHKLEDWSFDSVVRLLGGA
jgi:glycogenin glucosyltransferase